jgi:putative FmdB family regulatory protein
MLVSPAAARSRRVEGGAVPLYEYRCNKCGSCFEVDCAPEDREREARCANCGAKDVKEMTDVFLCEPPQHWDGEAGGGG